MFDVTLTVEGKFDIWNFAVLRRIRRVLKTTDGLRRVAKEPDLLWTVA
jgi:hypothetical protein